MAGRQLNPQERLEQLMELSGGACTWCGYDLAKANARPTRDHVVPKIKGGPVRVENEVASCASCNGKRGHTAPSQWIDQCRRERGLEPQVGVVAGQLAALEDVIASEGGLRKIRDYVRRERQRVEALANG